MLGSRVCQGLAQVTLCCCCCCCFSMRSFPEVNYRQCYMNMLFDNSATDKEVLSEGILQSRFLGNNLFKGAPSTSVHCGRALHRNHLLNVEIANVVLIVFENRIVSSQPKAIAGCDTLLKRNRWNPVIKHSK